MYSKILQQVETLVEYGDSLDVAIKKVADKVGMDDVTIALSTSTNVDWINSKIQSAMNSDLRKELVRQIDEVEEQIRDLWHDVANLEYKIRQQDQKAVLPFDHQVLVYGADYKLSVRTEEDRTVATERTSQGKSLGSGRGNRKRLWAIGTYRLPGARSIFRCIFTHSQIILQRPGFEDYTLDHDGTYASVKDTAKIALQYITDQVLMDDPDAYKDRESWQKADWPRMFGMPAYDDLDSYDAVYPGQI